MPLTRDRVRQIARGIEADLVARDTGLHKPQRQGLAALSTSVLATRSVNTSAWIPVVPRPGDDPKVMQRYILRFLANPRIDPVRVMRGFVPALFAQVQQHGATPVVRLVQSPVRPGLACLTLALRLGARALPLLWRVVATASPLGFAHHAPVLRALATMRPAGMALQLVADQVCGTATLIHWCQQQGLAYRIRLPAHLVLSYHGRVMTTRAAVHAGLPPLGTVQLQDFPVTTTVRRVHVPGQTAPWLMALSDPLGPGHCPEDASRWDLDTLFADQHGRSFGLTHTKLHHADRIERLMLILTIATYWTVTHG